MSPTDYFWLSLLLKAALTAGIIVTASLIVERGGPFLGAMIASLPTSVGAAYVIMALEHTPGFISKSSVGSLTANAAGVTFAAIYAVLAQSRSLAASLGGGLIAWFAIVTCLRMFDWTIWSALLLNAVFATGAILATVSIRAQPIVKTEVTPRFFDIPVRATLIAIFVIVVTTLSHTIGPFASGVFAAFPVAMSSFIVILHSRLGGRVSSNVIAHAQIPLLGMIAAFAIVNSLSTVTGVWWALLLALLATLLWNAFLWVRRSRFVTSMPLD